MSKKKIKDHKKIQELKNQIKQQDNNDKGKVKKSGLISNPLSRKKIISINRKKAGK